MYLAQTQRLHDELRVAVEQFEASIDGLKTRSNSDEYFSKLQSAFKPIGALNAMLKKFGEASVAETSNHDAAVTLIISNGQLRRSTINAKHQASKNATQQRFSTMINNIKGILQNSLGQFKGLKPAILMSVPSDAMYFFAQPSTQSIQNVAPSIDAAVSEANSVVKNVGPEALALYGVISISLSSILVFVFHLPLLVSAMPAALIFGFFFRRILRAKAIASHLADVAKTSCDYVRAQFKLEVDALNYSWTSDLARSEAAELDARNSELVSFQEVKRSLVRDFDEFDSRLAQAAATLGDEINLWKKSRNTQFSPLGSDTEISLENKPQTLLRIGEAMVQF